MRRTISLILLCSFLSTFVGRDAVLALETKQGARASLMTSYVPIRAKPSLLAETIGELGQGAVLVVLEKRGNWYRVCPSEGKEGWILADSSPLISMAGVSGGQGGGSTPGEEPYEANEPNPLILAAEWGCAATTATALGAAVGAVTFLVLVPVLDDVPDGLGGLVATAVLLVLIVVVSGLAGIASLPFGSAIGTTFAGGIANQRGSFWSALLGGGVGLLLGGAVGYSLYAIGEEIGQDWAAVAAIPILLGPPTGAVIGYNLSRPKPGARGSSLRFPEPPSLNLRMCSTEDKRANPKLTLNLVSLRF